MHPIRPHEKRISNYNNITNGDGSRRPFFYALNALTAAQDCDNATPVAVVVKGRRQRLNALRSEADNGR